VRRGKRRGAEGDLVGMLTDGGGVEGRPESGRRRSSGWLAARGSEQGEARGRLGRAAFTGHEREVPLARTLRWASRGPAAGPVVGGGEMGRAFGLGPDR
jgi:hypothetical protein